jgi:2-oxoisovalerate dehydrogenase E1 component
MHLPDEKVLLDGAIADPATLETFRQALLIRRVEQSLLELFAAGKLFGTVHTCVGQELVGVAIAAHLAPDDWMFSSHRCHGHFIAKTDLVEGLIAEVMGKTTGICGGWGGSQHLCARRFFSNGIQGGIMPVAAGLGLGEKLQASGNISVVFIGEGTLGEGVVYETANLASKWSIPLLIVLENNRFAQSTSQEEVVAGDIAARFAAFGIECFDTDTWSLAGLQSTCGEAVGFVRDHGRPAFLRIQTDRLNAHSKGDDDRPAGDLQRYRRRDLLEKFLGESPRQAAEVLEPIEQRISRAIDAGLEASYPAAADYDDLPPPAPHRWTAAAAPKPIRYAEAIRDCFADRMARDGRIVMIGEDIRSPYGGAFKVTKGLSDLFPDRVFNAPISEAAIVGIGNGLALHGQLPVCEIMFGDFLTLACDQFINHAAKFRRMYNEQVTVPLIVRTPMGGGRGYGPTHSQSSEKHFLGVPHTQCLALHQRISPEIIYNQLFDSIDRPTLVIENKLLYAHRLTAAVPAGFALEHSDEPFPTTRLRPAAEPDVTIVCYGGTVAAVEEAVAVAFDEHELACEVLIPSRLYPANLAPIAESARRSGRLLTVEEGCGFASWGAELLAGVHQQLGPGLRVSARCHSAEHCIPASGPLEKQILPNPRSILAAILGLAMR